MYMYQVLVRMLTKKDCNIQLSAIIYKRPIFRCFAKYLRIPIKVLQQMLFQGREFLRI